jgi:hypothetical protein
VSGEESADESAIRERTVELLFAKRDHKKFDHRESFEWVKANTNIIRSFGRSLLDAALRASVKEVSVWHDEGREYFDKALPERVSNNLCGMYAGICLMGELCKSLGLAFSDVFPLDNEVCAANIEAAAREYLLDNSSYNKGAVEQAFEVMARMKLKPKEDYAFENNRQFLCIHIAGIYDRYTRYRRDYAVLGEVLPYNQFRKQLEQTEFFVEKQRMKKMGEESKRVWVLDFNKLSALCDVSGFVKDVDAAED